MTNIWQTCHMEKRQPIETWSESDKRNFVRSMCVCVCAVNWDYPGRKKIENGSLQGTSAMAAAVNEGNSGKGLLRRKILTGLITTATFLRLANQRDGGEEVEKHWNGTWNLSIELSIGIFQYSNKQTNPNTTAARIDGSLICVALRDLTSSFAHESTVSIIQYRSNFSFVITFFSPHISFY